MENCKFGFKLLHNELPLKIIESAKIDHHGKSLEKKHRYDTRNKRLLNKALAKNKNYKNCIIYKGTSDFETLKAETRAKPNLQSFVSASKAEIFKSM